MPDSTTVFNDFYAAVLPHEFGAPLLWSKPQQAWLRRGRDGAWLVDPIEGDRVMEEAWDRAVQLVSEFTEYPRCRNCGCPSKPETHYICDDIFGNPQVYCVQVPSLDIVGDRGERSHVKHWGSPRGCRNVGSSIATADFPDDVRGPVACYLYGSPLPADEVIRRAWCRHCLSAVGNDQGAVFTSTLPVAVEQADRIERVTRALLSWVH